MIPQFPQFKKLELSDKKDVEQFTSKFPPYSDFNFISMWSWNVKEGMSISILNENLVVKFTDYITEKSFYSFLGNNEVNDTTEKLLNFSKKEGLSEELKLVPEDVTKFLNALKLQIKEDRDNFDYIYDIDLISEYKGSLFSYKRNKAKSFSKKFPKVHVEVMDLKNPSTKEDVLKLNEEWLKHKIEKDNNFKIKNELLATESFFKSKIKNIFIIGIFEDKRLIGYSVFETLPDKYSICHFCKADTHFNGIYDYLMRESTKILKNLGYSFLNYEQDLGIPGLRYAKTSFRPEFFKKFIVSFKK